MNRTRPVAQSLCLAADADRLLAQVRQCEVCTDALPHSPRPVLQLHPAARILIASQAPGRRVHETGVPFNDRSGERLRDWLGLTPEQFYDPQLVAIVPMGLCWPGTGAGGDLPPRPECTPLWRRPLLGALRQLHLTLAVGRFAIDWHLPGSGPLDERIRASLDSGDVIALPHPSPANNRWLARHRWFEQDAVPRLRERVAAVVAREADF